jgi:hypothetical protein
VISFLLVQGYLTRRGIRANSAGRLCCTQEGRRVGFVEEAGGTFVADDGTSLTARNPVITCKGVAHVAVYFATQTDDRQDRFPGV